MRVCTQPILDWLKSWGEFNLSLSIAVSVKNSGVCNLSSHRSTYRYIFMCVFTTWKCTYVCAYSKIFLERVFFYYLSMFDHSLYFLVHIVGCFEYRKTWGKLSPGGIIISPKTCPNFSQRVFKFVCYCYFSCRVHVYI